MAEATAREIGLSLKEALELVCCMRRKSRRSSSGPRCLVRSLPQRGQRCVGAEGADRARRVGPSFERASV